MAPRAKKSPAWTRKEGQNPEGGLNEAGRRSLRRQGEKYQTPSFSKGSQEKPSGGGKDVGLSALV